MSGADRFPGAEIHPTAVIEEGAQIAPGARVGALAYVGPQVRLAEGAEILPQAHVTGDTRLAEGASVHPFAVVGASPQDLKYAGEPGRVRIGPRAVIREHASIHIGTDGGGMETRIGADCLIMSGAHIAHDCQLAEGVIVVSNAALAGHVEIGPGAIIGGLAGIHQWVRVGEGAMIGGLAKVVRDVIPFGLVEGDGSRLDGLNLVGLRRRGVDRTDLAGLRAAFGVLATGEGTFEEKVRGLPRGQGALVDQLRAFVAEGSDRRYLTPAPRQR